MMYLISATATQTSPNGSRITRQIPTFLIDSRIQGLVGEEAVHKTAAEIINPAADPNVKVVTCVVEWRDCPEKEEKGE